MDATTAKSDPQALTDRLARVEAQQLRLERIALAVLILGGVATLMGQATPGDGLRVVEAERFVLRDTGGKARAELGFSEGGPSLAMFPEEGSPRATLALRPDGSPALSLHDKDGRGRAVLEVRPEGEPHLGLYDGQGKVCAELVGTPPADAEPDSTVRPAAVAVEADRDERAQATAALYGRLCRSCHGNEGKGTPARPRMPKIPDFSNPAWQASRRNPQLAASIMNGRGRDMPPFSDKVTVEQALNLANYVRSFGQPKAKRAGQP